MLDKDNPFVAISPDKLKEYDPEKLEAFLDNAEATFPGSKAYLLEKLKQSGKGRTEEELEKFITSDPETLVLKNRVLKIADIDEPVLIMGETGTGKEILARALHGKRKGPWIPINCGAIPQNLIESELFGHKKGAFTGAERDKTGLLETAKDGTLFLDEIGELPLTAQAKLLRTIQEKTIRRVGDTEERAINCRLVAATHRPIDIWIKTDRFREDLYYRISTLILKPKALRNRKKDIPLIVEHIDEEAHIKNLEEFCSRIDATKLHGNVRSLQQIVKRFIYLGTLPHEE